MTNNVEGWNGNWNVTVSGKSVGDRHHFKVPRIFQNCSIVQVAKPPTDKNDKVLEKYSCMHAIVEHATFMNVLEKMEKLVNAGV